MFTKTILGLLISATTLSSFAQKNFSYSPEKPRPGDTIIITYEPAGDIANTIHPVEAVVYQQGTRKQKADDLLLLKKGNKYTSFFITDTAMNFVYFSFAADKKFDNNYNNGYYIHLYENDKIRKGSNLTLYQYYQFMGGQAGVDRNNEKALAAMEKEFKLFPESRKQNLISYVRLQASIKKDPSPTLLQKEIEAQLKAGLNEEIDYENVAGLYSLAKLPEQAKLIANLKKEKFPNGNWVIAETIQKFHSEKEIEKKEELLAEITGKSETDKRWEAYRLTIPFLKTQLLNTYLIKKDWAKVKTWAEKIADKGQLASLYNNTAWEMQKTSTDLAKVEEMARFATEYAKQQWQKPASKRPEYMTEKQWKQNNEFTYAMYADTYAMVMYRMEQFKKGFSFTKDAAINIHKGSDPEQNNTYALLAEKVLPAKKLKPELEKFVKDGKSSGEIKEVLKRLYIKENKSEVGFDGYITALQEESRLKMLKEIQNSMLNETSPSFALVTLDGRKVDITDLKGKVVVVDFWATWCGPCKASFPGMQKMVTKYKDNPDVKFVFIDTWENEENKQKAVNDFITANKYTFDVWMDNENKVVEQFKVEGIPTKFVIDKSGVIRFKSVGFNGSDDKLIQELTAMIDLAGNSATKSF